LPVESGSKFLAIANASNPYLNVIAPSGKTERVRLETIRALLCLGADAPLRTDFDEALEEAGIPRRRRAIVRSALLREALGNFPVCDCWLLGLPPGANPIKQLRRGRLTHRFGALILLQLAQYLLLIGSWWVIGRGA